jgi:hypothetical protein
LKLGTPIFGEFLPFFSADPLKLSQVGWEASLHSCFQVSPDMFDEFMSNQLNLPQVDFNQVEETYQG